MKKVSAPVLDAMPQDTTQARRPDASPAPRERDDALEELEAFQFAISHDLRSPLGAIINYAAILREDYGDALDEEGRSHLERIERNARRVAGMLDDLLAFSRIGHHALAPEEVDVAALVRASFASAVDVQARADIELVIGDLPRAIADPELLGMALRQILDTAAKLACDGEPPRIVMTGARHASEVVYTVRVNGPGSDDDGDDSSPAPSPGERRGRSMGLALARRAIRRHGGSTRIETRAGKGATLEIVLPQPEDQA